MILAMDRTTSVTPRKSTDLSAITVGR